jgi:hypothetical protein
MQCISIDRYPETSSFTLYAVVNAKRSTQKATDWSGIKKDNSFTEIWPSWYPSTAQKHLQVYVKFDSALSIPFSRKWRFNKVGRFPREVSVLFPNGGV